MYRITCVAGAPPQINISTVKGNAVTSQRHKYTETTGSVTTNRKCLNLIWNLCNWVWRQQQWLLLMYKAVTGQFPAILAEDYTQPCLEQELEHCSAFCQEKTCTAALKFNVARQTYYIIHKNSSFPQDCGTGKHAPQIHILKTSTTWVIRTKERLYIYIYINTKDIFKTF